MIEFDCSECGHHIVDVAATEETRTHTLCATCIALPAWFKDAELRRILDPDHDGLEQMERNDNAE